MTQIMSYCAYTRSQRNKIVFRAASKALTDPIVHASVGRSFHVLGPTTANNRPQRMHSNLENVLLAIGKIARAKAILLALEQFSLKTEPTLTVSPLGTLAITVQQKHVG